MLSTDSPGEPVNLFKRPIALSHFLQTPSLDQPTKDLRARSVELLEFPKVREMLAGKTRYVGARELAQTVEPVWGYEEVVRLQTETAEARLLLASAGDIGLAGLADVRPLLQRASLGGTLTGEELLDATRVLDAAHEAAALVRSLGEQTPRLRDIAAFVGDFRWIGRRVNEALTEGGQVRDSATPRLGPLRRNVATTYNRLVRTLERIAASREVHPALQSSAIASRGERLVLEVKVEQRKAVGGIVHDVSNTGATLFIEPFACVDLCNDWRETTAEVAREESKVLSELSGLVADAFGDASASLETLAELDLIVARARLAEAMRATQPATEAPEGDQSAFLDLIDARHPILAEKAVPISVKLGEGFSALVVTGPNAGGKTVALKTVGLLALMHQAGLQIPAVTGSRLAVFDGVYADIGDAQSIERSVSTFTSHMGAVVRILAEATPRSLVLVDELGTGTDPEEGAALAMAIVSALRDSGVPTVVTTHHRSVSELANRREGVQNASVELDPQTLQPTYHLIMGLPGRSYAVSVARAMGLPDAVLADAEEILGARHAEGEQLLQQLQLERRKLGELAASAERERADAERVRRELERELADLRRRQEQIVDETRRHLAREADEFRTSLRRIEREARLEGHHAAARRAADQARRKLRDASWVQSKTPVPSARPVRSQGSGAPAPAAPETISPGDVVELKGLGIRGEVQSIGRDGEVELLIGGVTARLQPSEIRRLEGRPVSRTPSEPVRVQVASSENWSNEIDLRGMRSRDVHDAVTAFLDRCTMHGATSARIIHGRGTGAVRDAVRAVLADHPAATLFYPAERDQGGDGVTVVELA